MRIRATARLGFRVALLIGLVDIWVLMLRRAPEAIGATTITVNNLTDPSKTSGNGFCTLREAINNANSPGTDTTEADCSTGAATMTILFTVSGTVTLDSTLPAVQNNLAIDGTGRTVTIDGASRYQVLTVDKSASLTLDGLTIAHGYSGSAAGGGIGSSGALTVANCALITRLRAD
jgi:CSLREA domain-containing protein